MPCRPALLMGFVCSLALAAAAPSGTAYASRSVQDARKGGGRPRALPAIEMQHLTTHETFALRPDERGRLGGKRLRGLKHFLRCHHTGREHAMAPRLADLLYATAHHFGDRNLTVIAGYRAPKVARQKGNPRSPHKQGVACDFRVDGVKVTEVRDYVRRAFNGVGVGYYPNSGFIHLDVGRKQSAFWIDYSGPGERASYSSDPEQDLRTGAAEQPRAAAGDDDGGGDSGGQASAGAGVTPGDQSAADRGTAPDAPGVVGAAPDRTPIE